MNWLFWCWRSLQVLFLLTAVSLAGAGKASAQSCSFSMTDVNFGTVILQSGAAVDTTATLSASCQGAAYGTVRVCVNFGAGSGGAASGGSPRYMLSGANQLSYNLYQDAARTAPLGSYTGLLALLGGATMSVPLNSSGNGSASMTVYGRILAGQSSAATGSYLSSFAGGQATIYYQYLSLLTCIAILNNGPTNLSFNVLANVQSACSVTASNMDFGSVATLSAALNATSTITANCTVSTPYQIALDGGLSAAANPAQRIMSMGTNTITYGLYRNSQRNQPWGNIPGTNTQAAVGTGAAQPFTVYGQVPSQATPKPGLYQDTIVVTLTY